MRGLTEKKCDEIYWTLDGVRGLFCETSDYGNFGLAMDLVEEEKRRIARMPSPPLEISKLKPMTVEPQPVYLKSEKYPEGNGWKICYGIAQNGMLDFGEEQWGVQIFEQGYIKAYRNPPKTV